METAEQQASPVLPLGLRRQLLQAWHFLERCPRFFNAMFSRDGLGCARGRILIWGKLRRFVLTALPPVARRVRAHYRLSGGCKNCGASCNLLFRCPHWDERTHLCTVYEDRPNVCRFFPVTPADLHDRDLVRKDVPCGFMFNPQDDHSKNSIAEVSTLTLSPMTMLQQPSLASAGVFANDSIIKSLVPSSGDRLDSWKQIAVYLGREVRTVQRWERLEALPVRRHIHVKGGTVYAFKSEIDAWLTSRDQMPTA